MDVIFTIKKLIFYTWVSRIMGTPPPPPEFLATILLASLSKSSWPDITGTMLLHGVSRVERLGIAFPCELLIFTMFTGVHIFFQCVCVCVCGGKSELWINNMRKSYQTIIANLDYQTIIANLDFPFLMLLVHRIEQTITPTLLY